MSSEGYHEPLDLLSEDTRNLHRAITSLIEELEAVDWYHQRAEACSDSALQAVLAHNRDEEIEHAVMTLEWIRRHWSEFDRQLRRYVFSDAPITEIEEDEEAAEENGSSHRGREARSLGLGSLRGDPAARE